MAAREYMRGCCADCQLQFLAFEHLPRIDAWIAKNVESSPAVKMKLCANQA